MTCAPAPTRAHSPKPCAPDCIDVELAEEMHRYYERCPQEDFDDCHGCDVCDGLLDELAEKAEPA